MHKCKNCKLEFESENDLINHNIRTHSLYKRLQNDTEELNTKKTKLICDKCKKEFSYVSQLKRHKTSCLKCHLCNEQFDSNKKLQSHRMKHFLKEDNFEDDETDNYDEQNAFAKNLIDIKWNVKGYNDPIKALQSYKNQILNLLVNSLKEHRYPLKFSVAMRLRIFKLSKDEKEFSIMGLYSGIHHLMSYNDVEEKYSECSQQLLDNFEKWNAQGSGINLEKVESLSLKIGKTRIIQGSSYIPTPKAIQTRSLVNVQNKDNKCFEYSVLAALHYNDILYDRKLPGNYQKWIGKELMMDKFTEPMPIYEINRFEKLHNLTINVYYFDTKEKSRHFSPLYISKQRSLAFPINLLILDDGTKFHYTYIKKFSGLFNGRINRHNKICPYCLHTFRTNRKYDAHVLNCQNYVPTEIRIPEGDKKWIKFNKIGAMEFHPVVIYADFEALNIPINNRIDKNATIKTKKTTKQEVCGYSYTIVSPYFNNRGANFYTYRGENVINHFLKSIFKESKRIQNFFYRNKKPMNELTSEEKDNFEKATNCYICNEKFVENTKNIEHIHALQNLLKEVGLAVDRIPSKTAIDHRINQIKTRLEHEGTSLFIESQHEILSKLNRIHEYLLLNDLETFDSKSDNNEQDNEILSILRKGCKVKDHNHWTGNYRGPAHAMCNLKMRKFHKIPCFFHNFAGYDSHLLIKGFDSKLIKKEPRIVSKTMEKYVSLTLEKIEFKDSMQFLTTSLETLAQNLKSKGGELNDQFPNMWKYFQKKWSHLDIDAFQLLTEKQCYPYSYFKSFSNFEEKSLPPISCFFNDLKEEEMSKVDYERVQKLWDKFELQTLGDLHDLYIETDVFLLADCFEKFREFAIKSYRLDPAHFISAPSLSWESALLYTKINLEIPDDIDHHHFIDR